MALAHAHQSRVPLPAFTNSGHLRVIRNEEYAGPRGRTRMLRGRGAGRSGGQKMQEDALSLHLIPRIGVVCKDAYTEETGR